MFGVPPYGGRIIENVYYADDSMCSDKFDKAGGYPQRENGLPWQTPFILMIDRGGCTFVEKVRIAQHAGAAAVIIADESCQCRHLCKSEPGTDCETNEPIMTDDGTGSDISIPSMLMFKQDADLVKATLVLGKPVRMELRWSLPAQVDTVTYELWTTPADTTSEDLQLSFREAALALGDHSQFTPHMFIYDGHLAGCISRKTGKNTCQNLCTNNGRYCATDPGTDMSKGVSGADVVTESLRRLCIWQIYGSDGVGKAWWDYVEYFIEKCGSGSGSEFFSDENCIMDVMRQTGIHSDEVLTCMEKSGGTQEDVENTLLASEIGIKKDSGVFILPDVHVNGAVIRGTLTHKSIFEAICAGYSDGTSPTICNNCAKCLDVKSCVEHGYCYAISGAGSAVSKTSLLVIVVGVIVISMIGVFAGYKYHQKRMQKQIRMVLSEYMPVGKNCDKMEFAINDDDVYS